MPPRALTPLLLLFALLLAALAPPADARDILYPRPADAERWDYPLGLLRLALDRSGLDCTLKPTEVVQSQTRQIAELERGAIGVAWMGTSAALETRLRPIRIPIYRGLLGHRVCLIDRKRQKDFSAVHDLQALRAMTLGQGLGWSDVEILRNAGFTVHEGRYETLFRMVAAGRFDCFPRGVNEAPGEAAHRRAEVPDLAVEKELMVVYPFAMYFFVAPNDAELAAALEKGLKAAYDDGSFMTYFGTHPAIARIFSEARMEDRRRFDIDNPTLSPETRAVPDRFWHGRRGR